MPVGVLTNMLAGAAGIGAGCLLTKKMPQSLRERFPTMFGFCAMGIGVNSIVKTPSLTVAILATLIGYLIGHLLELENRTQRMLEGVLRKLRFGGSDMNMYITVVALFCFSGFGWYGTLSESIGGNPDILFSKSVLDFFTAMLFAAMLGRSLFVVPVMQAAVLLAVFCAGKLAGGVFTPQMFTDLSACGGILTLATGFRVAKIKNVDVINVMPALILVIPISALMTMF